MCEIFTVIALQDWVGWGIFTVIPGYPRRANGDSQHLKACPQLQDWLRLKLLTVKNYRTGPFSKQLGNNFERYSKSFTLQSYLHFVRGNQSIYLHCSGPLLESGLDRSENRYGRYGFASFLMISTSTEGLDGARVSL